MLYSLIFITCYSLLALSIGFGTVKSNEPQSSNPLDFTFKSQYIVEMKSPNGGPSKTFQLKVQPLNSGVIKDGTYLFTMNGNGSATSFFGQISKSGLLVDRYFFSVQDVQNTKIWYIYEIRFDLGGKLFSNNIHIESFTLYNIKTQNSSSNYPLSTKLYTGDFNVSTAYIAK